MLHNQHYRSKELLQYTPALVGVAGPHKPAKRVRETEWAQPSINLCILPICVVKCSIARFSHYISHILASCDMTDKYMPQAMQKTPEQWQRLGIGAKWQLFNAKIVQMACYCEVMQGIFLLIELVMPSRNFLFTLMWWQYLQMRYLMDQSGSIKSTFALLNSRINSILSHRLCPGFLRTVYGMITQFLAKQVQAPEPGQTPPSMSGMLSGAMSKCTIS